MEFEGEGAGNKTVAVALNIAWFMENRYAVAPLIPKSVFLKGNRCRIERIRLQFKALFRRFTGGKSRESNAEVQP